MDRSLAMLVMLGGLFSLLLVFLALFAVAPVFWSCVASLLYTLSLFLLNESHGVHNAQEFENRFWTIIAVLFSTALFFAKDSPLAFGVWSPSLGFLSVLLCGYAMHIWDRNMHRLEIGKIIRLKRNSTANASLNTLHKMGIPIDDQLERINSCLADIDQVFIPSTINNFINRTFVVMKEREIISIFEEAEPRVLNYLICNSRLGLIFYKIKDHRSFKHQHRTQFIELLAIEKISQLTVHSRVIVLHALQIMKLPANMRAEHCVRNIILSTKQDDLSELKTLMDAKGDYYCMNKLIYDDIKSEIVRNDILKHIQNQAKVQYSHMIFNTRRAKNRKQKFWRKVLSDVDDTLTCSAGSYPSGIDKRYGKKVVYPGVLGFYRELDLGTDGPEEWPPHTVGNLVFLSARPHIYRDVSEKINFAKFEKLQMRGMHTTPSLLAGDITSGVETLIKDDFGPLAQKKFDNFKKYVSIYPEFKHVFICDNGQGDVLAAELMVEAYPKNVEAIYVQEVQPISKTYKYKTENWKSKPVKPFFFQTYPEAALHAATRNPPLLRISGLRRICVDAINDFYMIQTKQWPSQKHKWDRHIEINQSLCYCNKFFVANLEDPVPLLEAERLWKDGQKVKTPYGRGTIKSFDPVHDLYEVELDWRPLNLQVEEYNHNKSDDSQKSTAGPTVQSVKGKDTRSQPLETVFEADEEASQAIVTGRSFDDSKQNSKTESSDADEECQYDDDSIAVPELTDDGDSSLDSKVIDNLEAAKRDSYPIVAKIHSRFITKYTPPSLPSFLNDGAKSGFSFWSAKPKSLFNKNDKCNTPYGYGTVVEYREKTGIVVLSMSGWSATCYLNAEAVKIVSEGFFNRMLRIISTEPKPHSPQKVSPSKEDLFLCTIENEISTPYGQGVIVRPLRKKSIEVSRDNSEKEKLKGILDTSDISDVPEMIGISLSSWKLANGSHPILYCTAESALAWKAMDEDESRSRQSGGIFSAFGSIVSVGMKKLIVGKSDRKPAEVPSEILVPHIERYYENGGAVVTSFGNGTVTAFRETDGMYTVTLDNWTMANNSLPKAFLRRDSLSHQIAPGCIEGYPVLTSFGLSGTLVSVQPKTGVHIVTIPMAGMVCYLQPKDVLRPLKAAVNDEVLTQYGNGKLIKFRPKDDMYKIDLVWGATLYARAEAFDRDFCKEETGSFGIDWVFRLFFSSENSTKGVGGGSQRSRSNSIASLRTQTTRSVL